ncbi:MAG TPA: DUF3397 domain-containing protein [Niallia sp.]|nr:DUF3397 domain-containing protein [Niallia sp.]
MMNFTSHLISLLVVFPIFTLFIVFVISKIVTKKQRYSVHLALDTSTFFFLLSVHFLAKEMWNVSLLPVIIVLLVIIGIVFSYIHYRIKEEIVFGKIIKGIWRLSFLLFFILYLFLMVYGLISSVLESVGVK